MAVAVTTPSPAVQVPTLLRAVLVQIAFDWLMAALPPALNVFVLANQYQAYVERASTAILVGTAVSAATVTLLLWLIAEQRLPVRLF